MGRRLAVCGVAPLKKGKVMPIWKQVVNSFGFALYLLPSIIIVVVEEENGEHN